MLTNEITNQPSDCVFRNENASKRKQKKSSVIVSSKKEHYVKSLSLNIFPFNFCVQKTKTDSKHAKIYKRIVAIVKVSS